MSFLKKSGTFTRETKESLKKIIEKRVLLLGLDNAGKTSIMFQMRDKVFKGDTVPTVGLNIELIKYHGFELTLWDVGG